MLFFLECRTREFRCREKRESADLDPLSSPLQQQFQMKGCSRNEISRIICAQGWIKPEMRDGSRA